MSAKRIGSLIGLGVGLTLSAGAADAATELRLSTQATVDGQLERQVLVTTDSGTLTSLGFEVAYSGATPPTVTGLGAAAAASVATNVLTPGRLAVALAHSAALPSGAVVALRYPNGTAQLLSGEIDEQPATIIADPITCYVLTAAFGRPDAAPIQALWALHTRVVPWSAPWHRAYLAWYDRVGPRMARFVRAHPIMAAAVRVAATLAARAVHDTASRR